MCSHIQKIKKTGNPSGYHIWSRCTRWSRSCYKLKNKMRNPWPGRLSHLRSLQGEKMYSGDLLNCKCSPTFAVITYGTPLPTKEIKPSCLKFGWENFGKKITLREFLQFHACLGTGGTNASTCVPLSLSYDCAMCNANWQHSARATQKPTRVQVAQN